MVVDVNRIKSGIPGMDQLIEGGFEKGSTILVSGGPGTGKTIMGLQFLYEGFKNGEAILYISFDEAVQDVIKDAELLGMVFDTTSEKVNFNFISPLDFIQTLSRGDFRTLLGDMKIDRLVIDTVSVLESYARDSFAFRSSLRQLIHLVKAYYCTTLLLAESTYGLDEETLETHPEEYSVDGVVLLHYAGLGGKFDRSLQVLKMRRTDHSRELQPMRIGDKGIFIGKYQP